MHRTGRTGPAPWSRFRQRENLNDVEWLCILHRAMKERHHREGTNAIRAKFSVAQTLHDFTRYLRLGDHATVVIVLMKDRFNCRPFALLP